MKDNLVSSLTFYKIREYEFAWLDAQIEENVAENEEGQRESAYPILVVPSTVPEDHKNVLINEPKLSDVKAIFKKNGLNAEFFSGVLIVNNCVAVKRSEAGKLLVEGTLSDTYFQVRGLLFSQFAVL